MQVTEVKSEGLSREYKVALPSERNRREGLAPSRRDRKNSNMPGFRPGKVPVRSATQALWTICDG